MHQMNLGISVKFLKIVKKTPSVLVHGRVGRSTAVLERSQVTIYVQFRHRTILKAPG